MIHFYKVEKGDKTDQGNTVEIPIKYDQSRSGMKLNLVTKLTPMISTFDQNGPGIILLMQ